MRTSRSRRISATSSAGAEAGTRAAGPSFGALRQKALFPLIEDILNDEELTGSVRWSIAAAALGGVVTASLARAVASCQPTEVSDVSALLEARFVEMREGWSLAFYVLALRRLGFALSKARGSGLSSPLLTQAAATASEVRRALGERRAVFVLWGEPDPNDPRRIRSLAPFLDS